jgi:acyl dehydratase
MSAPEIVAGDTLPEFAKTFTEVDLMAYGAATWDWHRNHYDQRFARELAFKDSFVDGQNFGAIFAQQIMRWAGPRAFIAKMSLKFRAMVHARESVTGEGRVSALRVEAGYRVATIEQRLMKGGELAASATSEVRLPIGLSQLQG